MTTPPHPATVTTIRREDPAQPDVVALLRNGEAASAALYPAESNHHLSLEGLREADVYFLVARDAEGRAVATGALVAHGDWAEIKRMWVEEHARGRGLSRDVLDTLIAEADRTRIAVLRLETGVVSHAALALYDRTGFVRRGPFADYAEDPLSVFMERRLRPE
ncbi:MULTISPECIES: GNAT family N-acetyltransferase [Methylobacterium]|uniref:GNAT family N-acetyltransferase n=1 Tax=Methylobacterium TaxID=407 RepID=UPI0013EB5AEF|nr:GNAT family N-acetyltransferase [Methylobacterium sp. DB0501]NGM36405.1 GNAT family N-acetyltransferase [Methylobacterium sp. DB0501]